MAIAGENFATARRFPQSAGIRMVIAGDLDFALSSKGIDSQLRREAAEKGLKLKEMVVAINGNAIAVHPSLKIPGLTVDQVRQIKSGKISNWKEVGGPDRKIQIYSTDERYLSGAPFQRVSNATEGLRKVAEDPAGFHQASVALVVPQCGARALPIGLSPDAFVAPYQLPLIPPEQCTGDVSPQFIAGQAVANGARSQSWDKPVPVESID